MHKAWDAIRKAFKKIESVNMQVLVTYYSRTGSTKKLTEEIAEGMGEVEEVTCLIKRVSEVTREDFSVFDGILVRTCI